MNPNPERSLTLECYLGRAIPNSIDLDPSPGMVQIARNSYRMNSMLPKELGPPGNAPRNPST
jgi:hypothetical protein